MQFGASSPNAQRMSAHGLENLPLAQRLALSYAPARSREAILTLLLLDNRLAAVLRQRGENVLIAQMKLAWWRDRLGQQQQEWPRGEPLLARLRDWPGEVSRLIGLVDGWEGLLGEELDQETLANFAQGRALAWCALARGLRVSADMASLDKAAGEWALLDLALHLSPGEEREAILGAAQAKPSRPLRLDRRLRPMTILLGLTRRAAERGSRDLLDGPGAVLTALRLGIFGR